MTAHVMESTVFPPGLDTRDLQVCCLQSFDETMRGTLAVPQGMHVGIITSDSVVLLSATFDDAGDVFTDEDWLARAIIDTAGDAAVIGFVVGFTPIFGLAATIGLNATGRVEQAATLLGQNVMQEVFNVQFKGFLGAQARRLWGEAWSPLP